MGNSNNNQMPLSRITSRRRVLQALGAAGIAGAAGMWTASAQSTIELEGEVEGWQGITPDDIEGQTNPTLSFEAGENVTIDWTNADGAGHNFTVVDSDGGTIVSSDILTEEEGTQTVEFTASEDMTEYLCQPHPNSMRGNIQVEEGGGGEQDQEEGAQEPAGPLTKTQLTEVSNGMKLDVAPDGRIFYTTRGSSFEPDEEGADPRYPDDPRGTAKVSIIDPESEEVTTALELDVYVGQEDGGQGITFDPNFEENGWVYLFYSPSNEAIAENDEELESLNQSQESPDEASGEPYNLVSRFTVEGDTIDPDSEVKIIRIPNQRERCCHVGGALEFDLNGYLLITTGDDTDPFESDDYTPIDERVGRQYFDAQRTAANTADLRGKVLRICPHDNGSYSIPDGNLFPEDEYADEIEDGTVRPEIYGMGFRNPFTLEVDQETGEIYVGDYGPDASEWDDDRGPIGIVEVNRVSEAGFYGWPYFVGPNIPYIDGEFKEAEEDREDDSPPANKVTHTFESTGEPFDPENPVNDLPNNTGLAELPAAQEATIWYPYSWDELLGSTPDYAAEYIPEEIPYPVGEDEEPLEGGSPMAGSVYYRPDDAGENALPAKYDGRHLFMERRGYVKNVTYDENGEVAEMDDFMPNEGFSAPMNLETGPDGALYLIEERTGVFRIEPTGEGENGGDDSDESDS